MVKKSTFVRIPKGSQVWFLKSELDIAEERTADRAEGRYHDDAGESILYSNIGSYHLEREVCVWVIKTTGVEWKTWSRKPKFLRVGLRQDTGNPIMFSMK